jgi:thymidylate synthase (FAD)
VTEEIFLSTSTEVTTMDVQCVGTTTFHQPKGVPWEPEIYRGAGSGADLVEFAGRACYQSWAKPNPATATNAGYIKHLLSVGHFSVLEHGVVSLYITGVSRSLTHELVRHRHFSYSQLSQRYVPERDAKMVVPQPIFNDVQMMAGFMATARQTVRTYTELLRELELRYTLEPNLTLRRKLARQAARAILPNATETKIVVTGNYRAWRHFLKLRATEHADMEIRALAVACLRVLWEEAPGIFNDFEIYAMEDGTEIAISSVGGEV